MRKGIFTCVCVCIICLDVLTTCRFRNPKEPVKPITEVPDKPFEAETISPLGQVDPVEPIITPEKESEVDGERKIPLTIIVDNLTSADAPVEFSVYGPENKFLDSNDHLDKYRFKPRNGKVVAKINNLAYGDLAIALYQDVNSDGKIDKNVVGIPQEPYAFSNNYKPLIKAPSFNDCKFSYTAKTNTVNISLIK